MKAYGHLLFSIVGLMLCLCACTSIPDNVSAVRPFDKNRYLGTWYEIARFDFRFEKNLNNTTANYTLNPDESIRVINTGFDVVKNEWKQVTGKAKFVGEDTVGMLKVSFFGPFYGGYNVIALDPDYKYSLVCGDSRDYCGYCPEKSPSRKLSKRSMWLLLKV